MSVAEKQLVVDSLWAELSDSSLAASTTAVEQLTYLFLIQYVELADTRAQARAAALGTNYDSVFDDDEATECRWSYLKQLDGKEMFELFPRRVFPWLQQRHADLLTRELVANAVFAIPTADLLVQLVSWVDELELFSLSPRDRAALYEHILQRIEFPKKEASKLGKFRTPRHIVGLVVDIVAPRRGDVIVDPACGTGGFLSYGIESIIRRASSSDLDEGLNVGAALGDKLSDDEWKFLMTSAVEGIDADPQMTRLASMSLFLRLGRGERVHQRDSLSQAYSHQPRASIVMTNPPFSSRKAAVADGFAAKSADTALLYLMLAMSLLRPGGRAAIVLADGPLFKTTKAHKNVRKRLLDEFRIDGVISLPQKSLHPSPISASILLFSSASPLDDVWMYKVEADGFTLDNKRLPTGITDFDDVRVLLASRETNDRALLVQADAVRAADYDLTVERYLPPDFIATDYPPPEALVSDIVKHAQHIAESADSLASLIRGPDGQNP